eukprot:symbB.v1.2.029813.t1/scaffold3301.1/size59484/6
MNALNCIAGKLFIFREGKRLAKALLQQGDENPRMFKMFMGPKPSLAITHPDLARQVLTRHQDFRKADNDAIASKSIQAPLNYTKDGQNASIVMTNGAEWQALRKPVDPTFEKQALRRLVPKFVEATDKLLDTWKGSNTIDAKRDMSRFAVDVLGAATFGQGFGAIEGGFDDTYRPRTVWQMAKMIGLPNCVLIFYTKKIGVFAPEVCGPDFGHNDLRDGPCGVIFSMSSWSSARRHYNVVMQEMLNPVYLTFPVLERLPTPRNIRYKKAVDHMFKVLEGAVESRIEKRREEMAAGTFKDEPQDMLDMMLGSGLDPQGVLPKGCMVPVLWIFFLAGHDTTAVSLAWTMHFLARHPEVQAKARQEAFEVLNGKKDPDADDLEKVPYINAVISECLRLRPPVYNLISREAAVDTELDGVAVPKGTGISLHIGAINRHPEVWENPSEFDPERQPRIFNYLPFSAGPRRCLGDKFSLLEQRTLLLKLLTQFEVLPDGDTARMAQQEATYTKSAISLMLLQPEEIKVRIRSLH